MCLLYATLSMEIYGSKRLLKILTDQEILLFNQFTSTAARKADIFQERAYFRKTYVFERL